MIYLIPTLHLIAFTINILIGKHLGKKAALISIGASIASFLIALPVIGKLISDPHHPLTASWEWIKLGNYSLDFGYWIDAPGASLLFVVTFVGTLILIYSYGYMHDDKRFSRFFAYISLFKFAMLALVIANNFIMFFMSWEIMGLCSYLLIGFWFEKDSAANASRKAFLTTRVGDIGFFLGILTLFLTTGNLSFSELGNSVNGNTHALLPAAALLIFCGTIGKSAQFPLHVWLPDAMEGPTSVSALIHAATMVAAGVFLIVRSFPLFEAVPSAMTIVTVVGTLTAFMAAFIALTATDIKKVLAYSTISQLGFMVAALGLNGFAAGNFHLMTHAFFKALLFLGAGSVIHGTGTQDIRQLGGLFGKMKHTGWTFLIASLAIAGVPPLSGFWSKDEILLAAAHSHNGLIYGTLVLTAFMTSFYMFRLVFLTFFGKARNSEIHPHESPKNMTIPLWLLAIGSIVLGIPGSPLMGNWYQTFLHGGHHVEHHIDFGVMITSIFIAGGGILLAAFLYLWKPEIPGKISKAFKPLYTASQNKLWFDELYSVLLVRPFHKIGHILFGFDQKVIDGAVNGTGLITLFTSSIHQWFDKYIVDGIVNLVGQLTQFFSSIVRRLQTGYIQNYLLIVFVGLLVLIYIELQY